MASEYEEIMVGIAETVFPLLNSAVETHPIQRPMSDKESECLLRNLTEIISECGSKATSKKDPYLEKLVQVYQDETRFRLDYAKEVDRIVEMQEESSFEGAIARQKSVIDERNIESAVQSFETLFAESEANLLMQIETGAKALEMTIPQLHSNLTNTRKEFSESHSSFELLDAAITTNYCVIRDGFLNLLRRYFNESVEQLIVSSRLEEQTSQWQQAKINEAINAAAVNPELRQKRQQQHKMIGDAFLRSCDKAFNHLIKNNNFEEREKYFQKLLVIKQATSRWKINIVTQSEDVLNDALRKVDSFYLTHLEELTEQLARLKDILIKAQWYDKSLEQKLQSMVLLHEKESRKNRHIKGHLSVAQTEMFKKHNDSQEMIRFTELQNSTLRIGTSLQALAKSAGLSDEELEGMLLDLLPH